MALNSNPSYNLPFVALQGRPQYHEEAIRRHGQFARILQAKKCACITNGKPVLFCNICKGKGYLTYFHKKIQVIDEVPAYHCYDCQSKTATIKTWWSPIVEVMRVQRILHESQGGNAVYDVISFSDDIVNVNTSGKPILNYHQVKISYVYNNANPILKEDSFHDGSFVIKTRATEQPPDANFSNSFFAHGDICRVVKVYNATQKFTYTVLRFNKQSIYLDSSNNAPAPLVTDVLEVDYDYIQPIKIATGRIEHEYALQKWGEDIKEGDIEATLSGNYPIGRGDIITFLTSMLKGNDVITRGANSTDPIPQFDVFNILEDIEDEDGVIYTKTDFELRDYNDIFWKTTHKPAVGKKYSVSYRFRPTYTVYKRATSQMNAEDKVFPQNIYLRLISKFDIKELDPK